MKYRKIDPKIWNDAKFNSLSDKGKLLFFFLLTHPHMTPVGAMRASVAGLSEELGWSTEAFREALGEALTKAMVRHNDRAFFISLPNFIKYNAPESPNVVKAWAKCMDDIPECQEKDNLYHELKALLEGYQKAFKEAFREAFRQPLPNQEQEQEQEQDIVILANQPKLDDPGTNNKTTKKQFTQPTIEEITEYCVSRNSSVNPARFEAYYQANGWKVGRNHMKDWKAAVRTWEQYSDKDNGKKRYLTAGEHLQQANMEAAKGFLEEYAG